MSNLFNICCDESCHLVTPAVTPENRFMALGAVMCQQDKKRAIFDHINTIKIENDIGVHSEMKWTKISPSKQHACRAIIY